MDKEGIQETKENQLNEPIQRFELYTKEARDMVFEDDESEDAKSAQTPLLEVQRFVVKKAEAKQTHLLQGWNDGDPEDDMSEEELPEDTFDEDDEEALMEDIRQHAAKLPTQEGKENGEPALLSLEAHAKLRSEAKARQKAAREKEGKTSKNSKPSGKAKPSKDGLVKQGGKKHGPTPAANKKDQLAAQNAANEGA